MIDSLEQQLEWQHFRWPTCKTAYGRTPLQGSLSIFENILIVAYGRKNAIIIVNAVCLHTCMFMSAYLSTAGSRSSSPGKLLKHSSYGRIPRATASASNTPADKRSRIPRSQGCSRENSPSRMGIGMPGTLQTHNLYRVDCCFSYFTLQYDAG